MARSLTRPNPQKRYIVANERQVSGIDPWITQWKTLEPSRSDSHLAPTAAMIGVMRLKATSHQPIGAQPRQRRLMAEPNIFPTIDYVGARDAERGPNQPCRKLSYMNIALGLLSDNTAAKHSKA
jgi:hypothetical protein